MYRLRPLFKRLAAKPCAKIVYWDFFGAKRSRHAFGSCQQLAGFDRQFRRDTTRKKFYRIFNDRFGRSHWNVVRHELRAESVFARWRWLRGCIDADHPDGRCNDRMGAAGTPIRSARTDCTHSCRCRANDRCDDDPFRWTKGQRPDAYAGPIHRTHRTFFTKSRPHDETSSGGGDCRKTEITLLYDNITL